MTDDGARPGARWATTLLEGLRTVALCDPRWTGGQAAAPLVVVLVLAVLGVEAAAYRLAIDGPAEHAWWVWGAGWLGPLLLVAACWVATRLRDEPSPGPSAATVFAWTQVQGLVLSIPAAALYVAQGRGVSVAGWDDATLGWLLFGLDVLWPVVAAAVLLSRLMDRGPRRFAVAGLMLALLVATAWMPRGSPWYAPQPPDPLDGEAPRTFTQEGFEAQSRVLVESLDGVLPQRPGVTELYAITFAPYADEDVFSREVAMVGGVLRERFDTAGRHLNLQNHTRTLAEVPWATPLNLQRAIGRMGERMDPDEDILFLHLTSHGARDGRLAAGFDPLRVDAVTPTDLRRWLDDAGIRHAVISISACFSGSWIPALEAPGTLVLTAADATHTSYGCGRRSELTFFGRAVYDEQLRQTRSFEKAYTAALPVIDRREKEAGKTDGPSNPQMRMGEAIRPRLAALEARLEGQ